MRIPRYITILTWLYLRFGSSFSIPKPPMKVLVTGASGKTGRLVFESLLAEEGDSSTTTEVTTSRDNQEKSSVSLEARALVRNEKSAKALRQMVPETRLDQIVICDVAQLDASKDIPSGLEGMDAMIICTSAMPVINKLSLLKALVQAPINLIRGKKAVDFRSFKFGWKGGQHPEIVDYQGQKAQIDLAKKLGIKHVVVVGSMGGTDPDNFLNSIGKNQDGTGNGDILVWKRKAEKYLVDSGLDYTIIHPGGLRDDPSDSSDSSNEQFVLDVDDKLLKREQRSIRRADVAKLCVAALKVAKGQKLALDVITSSISSSIDDESTTVTGKTAEEALQQFMEKNIVYEYA